MPRSVALIDARPSWGSAAMEDSGSPNVADAMHGHSSAAASVAENSQESSPTRDLMPILVASALVNQRLDQFSPIWFTKRTVVARRHESTHISSQKLGARGGSARGAGLLNH